MQGRGGGGLGVGVGIFFKLKSSVETLNLNLSQSHHLLQAQSGLFEIPTSTARALERLKCTRDTLSFIYNHHWKICRFTKGSFLKKKFILCWGIAD